jgi:hypothetical protein
MYNQFRLAMFCVQTLSLVFNKGEIVFSLHFLLHVSSLLAGISFNYIAYPAGSINWYCGAKSDIVNLYFVMFC